MIAPLPWHRNLTAREIEVCELVAHGFGNRVIGEKLGGISHRTVEDYRARAMRKLGVCNAILLTRKVLGIDPP